MGRYTSGTTGLAAAVLTALTLAPFGARSAQAQDASTWTGMRPTLNLFGNAGLIDTPTAHPMRDADLSLTLAYIASPGEDAQDMARGAVNFQIGPRLSGTFRYIVLEELGTTSPYMDRGFDVRYLLAEEGSRRPALSLGLNDLAGTGYYSSEYLVASKTFGRLRATLGIGWGRLAEIGGFDNPLSALNDAFGDRPEQDLSGGLSSGELDSSQWFRGDAALFGGVQYLATDHLILTLEHSSNSYEFEQASLDFDYKTPINVGATWRFDNGLDLSAALLHGSALTVQMNYVLNAKTPTLFPTGHGDVPPALTVRPRFSAADLGWSLQAGDLAQGSVSLDAALQAQGLELVGFGAQGRTARLRYRNISHINQARALGRAARILARHAPHDIDTFVLEPVTDYGVTATRVTLARADLEDLEQAPDGAWQSFARADLDTGFDPSVPVPFTPDFSWHISPYVMSALFDPRADLRYDAGIETGLSYQPAPGWVIAGSTQLRIYDWRDHDVSPSTASQNVPRVRTGAREYLAASRFGLQDLYVSKYMRPGPDLYARASLGYFEHMYGGVSGEVLWAPQTSKLALGAELNWVKQRAFERDLRFQDYDVVTGHVSAYLRSKGGMHYQLDAGRYLAGDWGTTLKVEREFANGIRLGAFATVTDMDTDDFGEGSFDKGISFDIPLSALTGKRGRQSIRGNFRPILGDGGARLTVPGRLYDALRDTRQGRLQTQWGEVFR